jgi:signal transduction histidine kinase
LRYFYHYNQVMRVIFLIISFGFLVCCINAQGDYNFLKDRVKDLKTSIGKGNNVPNEMILNQAGSLKDSIYTSGYFDLYGDILMTIGRLCQQMGRMGNAELYYKEGLGKGQKYNDSLWVAAAWDRLGDFYALEERSFLSLECHLKALQLRETYDTTRITISDTYHNIARSYIQTGALSTAEKYLEMSLKLKKELNDTLRLGIINTLYADIYRLKGQYALAEKYYLKDLPKRLQQNNFEGQTISFLGLAQNYQDWGKFKDAEVYFLKALHAAETINRQRNIGLILLKLGTLYKAIGQPDRAKAVFQRAIESCTQVDSRAYQLSAYRNLYVMYKEDGNLPKAMEYLELFTAVQDTSSKEFLNMKMEDFKAALDLKEKEKEIAALDGENKKGKQIRNMLIIGICLLLLSLIFLVVLYRSRNKANKKLYEEQIHAQSLLSEKEKLLADLQHTNLQLIHSEKMASLGVMTAGIAHELNNPVSSIHAGVEALMMDFKDLRPLLNLLSELQNSDDADVRFIDDLKDKVTKVDVAYLSAELEKLMKTINNGSQRTSEIIQGLKIFARDTGDQPQPFYVEEGIETALTLLHHKLKPNIQIIKSYQFDGLIMCQVSKINQVLLNILDNAIQAVDSGGTIHIETNAGDNQCNITIKDTGPGMDVETQKKIFEPFFTTKDVGKGTGLGLSISYAIIQQHKGNITVESEPGKGTSFIISLPLKKEL